MISNGERDRGFGVPHNPNRYRPLQLPDEAMTCAPEPVRQAHAAAVLAVDRLAEQQAKVRAAIAALAGADAADRAAVKAALDRGKNVPAPTAEAKRTAVDDAQRALQAAAELCAERFAAFGRVVLEHHDDWRTALTGEWQTATENAAPIVEAAAEAFVPIERSVRVLAWLRRFDPERAQTFKFATVAADPSPARLIAELRTVAGKLPHDLSQEPKVLKRRAEEIARRLEHRKTSPVWRAREERANAERVRDAAALVGTGTAPETLDQED